MKVFKTKLFSAKAKKALITDAELCDAIAEVIKGQANDLGGGVWKKRLNKNRHRSIILAKGANYWVYQFLFAKSDQDNITHKELLAFKKLAEVYARLTREQVEQLLEKNEFVEIGHEPEIQQ